MAINHQDESFKLCPVGTGWREGEGQVLNSGSSQHGPCRGCQARRRIPEGGPQRPWLEGRPKATSQPGRAACRPLIPLSVASPEHTSPSSGSHCTLAVEAGERSKLRLPWADAAPLSKARPAPPPPPPPLEELWLQHQ